MSKRDLPEVPETVADLAGAIEALIHGVYDPAVAYGPNTDSYGKCVEAMWRAAYIAHEVVAKLLGVTGFQHSVSSLTLVGALRDIEGPYRLVDSSKALYPQYDLLGDTEEFLRSESVRGYLADQAEQKLADAESRPEFSEWVDDDGVTHRTRRVNYRVEDHWRRLVADRPTPKES